MTLFSEPLLEWARLHTVQLLLQSFQIFLYPTQGKLLIQNNSCAHYLSTLACVYRSKVLALFYFAVPVGTGLGYMVGSEVGQAAEDWRWGLRVTPFMGLLAVLLIVFVMTDPPRGGSEGGANLQAASDVKEDLMSLKRNKSFCLSTIAFTCVAFCVGKWRVVKNVTIKG